MKIGRFVYDRQRGCYLVVNSGGAELRELHPGDALTVKDITDDPSQWVDAHIRHNIDNACWYLVTQYGRERDDFDLLDVLI